MSREKLGKIGNLAKICVFWDFRLWPAGEPVFFAKNLQGRWDFDRRNEAREVFTPFEVS
jgi:hypothetical protein